MDFANASFGNCGCRKAIFGMTCGLLGIVGHINVSVAETFRHITAESGEGAFIDEMGALTEGGVSFRPIYKPVPRSDWCKKPWVETREAFRGSHSIGMGILGVPITNRKDVDKVNLTISDGNDPFALKFGNKRYTGFAVKFPSKDFQVPDQGRQLLIAQWWQGAPYGPPLRLAITSDTKEVIAYKFVVKNDDTLGNPSVFGEVIGEGSVPFDSWVKFVVLTIPDFTGHNGEVRVWVDGNHLFKWNGKLGYSPSWKPYKGASSKTPFPNKKFNIFIGPYRERQNRFQEIYFDEIKFADTYDDSSP